MEGEGAAECTRTRGIARAHVDHQRIGLELEQRFQHHFAHGLAVGKHRDEHIGALRGFPDRAMAALAPRVIGLHQETRGGEIRRHRLAHRAQPDEGYSFYAKTSFAPRNATTAAGTPHEIAVCISTSLLSSLVRPLFNAPRRCRFPSLSFPT